MHIYLYSGLQKFQQIKQKFQKSLLIEVFQFKFSA